MKKKSYMERRFNEMKHRSNSALMTAGMFIRIILLLVILAGGKFVCDWAVDQSHNSVNETDLKLYQNKKLRSLLIMRNKNFISDEEMIQMSDSINKNLKRDYIRERR